MRTAAALMSGLALAASFGLHLAGFAMMSPPSKIAIEGGAPMQMAMLGNSFADMTEGTISPVTPTETANTPDEPKPMVNQPITLPDQVPLPQPTHTAAAIAENLINPVAALLATPPEPLVALVPTAPLETLKAKPPEVQKAAAARPVTRAPKPATAQPKPTTPRRKPAAEAPPKRQGGAQTARKGQANGSSAGTAASSSTRQGKRASAAGNAAVSNYPGLVMRKISRTRKQRAGARGKATVGFKVSASGAATSVRIIRSSGSAKIDNIALRHIKRASPFARPPKGARRSFSVVFVSKG